MTEQETLDRKEREMKAHQELLHLKENYSRLKDILTPQAIMAVFLLLGDEMWVKKES